MKLSISNIGWAAADDEVVYEYLGSVGVTGIEIAPTRVFPEAPYGKLKEAEQFKKKLKAQYKLSISSLQSIWYGKAEKIFHSEMEREVLLEYTKSAIDFASALDCDNLVFGCPQNRVTYDEKDYELAVKFFFELGEYACQKSVVLALEPNPVIYNTNFINTTEEAISMVKLVNSKGFKVNLDIGTVIYNEESLQEIGNNIDLIHHIHISEPRLALIQKRKLHNQLMELLSGRYHNYISIEMGKRENLGDIFESVAYVKEVFNDL